SVGAVCLTSKDAAASVQIPPPARPGDACSGWWPPGHQPTRSWMRLFTLCVGYELQCTGVTMWWVGHCSWAGALVPAQVPRAEGRKGCQVTSQTDELAPSDAERQAAARHAEVALRSIGSGTTSTRDGGCSLQIGPLAATGVGSYIALAGLWALRSAARR